MPLVPKGAPRALRGNAFPPHSSSTKGTAPCRQPTPVSCLKHSCPPPMMVPPESLAGARAAPAVARIPPADPRSRGPPRTARPHDYRQPSPCHRTSGPCLRCTAGQRVPAGPAQCFPWWHGESPPPPSGGRRLARLRRAQGGNVRLIRQCRPPGPRPPPVPAAAARSARQIRAANLRPESALSVSPGATAETVRRHLCAVTPRHG